MEDLSQFNTSASGANDTDNRQAFEKITDYLQLLTEIRILVSSAPGYGHQTTSVNILRRLIHWDITEPLFVLLLQCTDNTDYLSKFERLQTLIPQCTEPDVIFQLGGVDVKVIALNPSTELLSSSLCIAGGFDDLDAGGSDKLFNTLISLRVKHYLQIQPYAWNLGSNLAWFSPNSYDNYVYLDKKYPNLLLSRRAFYLPEPQVDQDDIDAIEKTTDVWKQSIFLYLNTTIFNICPIYGIANDLVEGYSVLYNLISGICESQHSQTGKTVVIVLGMYEEHWEYFRKLILSNDLEKFNVSKACREWHKSALLLPRFERLKEMQRSTIH